MLRQISAAREKGFLPVRIAISGIGEPALPVSGSDVSPTGTQPGAREPLRAPPPAEVDRVYRFLADAGLRVRRSCRWRRQAEGGAAPSWPAVDQGWDFSGSVLPLC